MKKLFILAMIFCSASALAGPARPIQSSNFQVQTPCGPLWDSMAMQGQWFSDPNSGATNACTWEFHDDDQSLTIAGTVQSITFSTPGDTNSNILAFDVLAVVSNNLPADYAGGTVSNSHGEVQTAAGVTSGGDLMQQVRITAEFALAETNMIPSGSSPYWPDPVSAGQYHIVAANEDERAWYCWTPGLQPPYQPAGKFQVPSWKLTPFDIPIGNQSTVLMQFTITGSGMPISDYRHSVIRASQQMGLDVLYNRHTSLKISHWLDTLLIDAGTSISTPPPPFWQEEPIEYIYASDASVFYNEEDDEVSHKMHWPQLPDPNGWDVRACNGEDGLQKVLADDFLCTASGPITNIIFWGSWFSDEFIMEDPFQGITNIHLSIHNDIPDPDGTGSEYSKPELPALIEWNIDPQNPPQGWLVTITPEEPSMQGWYDPNMDIHILNNHSNYFRYDIIIPTNEAFVQTSNTIYWLDVSVETTFGQWGWKTSVSEHFMDDAVWADLPVINTNQWRELIDPETGISLDLAFIIDGPDEPEPEEKFDWGDLPDSYNTLSANLGANHTINMNYILGTLIDDEFDGQPTVTASGDDVNNLADEDGITFTSLFVPGQTASFNAVASAIGQLDVWMDLNGNGAWDLPGEHVFTGGVVAGPNPFSFPVPIGTPSGQNYLRFRYTSSTSAYTGGIPAPTGNATDGEVEDYAITVERLDWGDAPDTPYPTFAASSGANHLIGTSLYLGTAIDAEPNGQPSTLANGDDIDAGGDDEDGITFKSPFFPGAVAQIDVTTFGSGLLNIWIDFNMNGSWMDAGEQVYIDLSLSSGTTTLTIPVPTSATLATNTYMRVRYSSVSGLQPTGYASDGEVEDYQIDIEDIFEIDWGDLPDPGYPVLSANNGAHHVLSSPLFLGATVDGELDGQQTINADGDDTNLLYPGIPYPLGDEDGVIQTCSALMPGGYSSVDVIASQAGILDAWIDFNLDSAFSQLGDQIFSNQSLVQGTNSLLFPVPLTASSGIPAHCRFRITSGASAYPSGTAIPAGLALDGEVEDYHWLISPVPSGSDWSDAPDPNYPTLLTSSGANHPISAGVMLGATIDAETNGVPKTAADGDDTTGLDDEDGVTFASKIVAGANASINVVAGVSGGYLDAWIDFNADGDWFDAGEQIVTATLISAGMNNLNIPIPQPSALGPTYARFRITSLPGGLPADNSIIPLDGEVEDYLINLYQPQTSTDIVITNIIVTVSNAVAKVEWNAENNISYQVQSSSNLLTNVWTDVGGSLMGPINWQTNSAVPTQQFYRVTAPWTE